MIEPDGKARARLVPRANTSGAAESHVIVGLGEAMVRLSTLDHCPIEQAGTLNMSVAGSELNVLVTAVAFGVRARWVTRLPANSLGGLIERHARRYGVEVVAHLEPEGRAGVYFLEYGSPPRATEIVYDRAGSAASLISADEFVWPEILAGADVVHVSGITCALSDGALGATRSLYGAARDLGIATSFEVNYRSKLWSRSRAAATCCEVLPLVDVLFVSPEDLALLTGRDAQSGELADEVVDKFGIALVVIRQREDFGPGIVGTRVHVHGESGTEAVAQGQVVDEIGAGDAATGAFLAAMLTGADLARSCMLCARAYARMVTIPGDAWSGGLDDLMDNYAPYRRVSR